jgi:RND family efflux transporter MFP subunit
MPPGRVPIRPLPVALTLALILGGLLLIPACDRERPAIAATPETEAETSAPAAIEARVRVRVEAVDTIPLGDAGAITGVVEPWASVIVAAETSARVTARAVERGDQVEADALLFTLDGSRARIAYQQAEASVDARRKDLGQAERELGRTSTLHQREGVSAAALDRSAHASEAAAAATELARLSKRAAARGLRDAKIRAPFAGEIAELHAELGDFLGPGAPVATLVDRTRVRLRVGLSAAELDLVALGDELQVEFADLGGRQLDAELRSVSPLADPRTGTYAAELWLDNPGLVLRQGMIGRIELGQLPATEALTIPRAAVVRRVSGYAVWIVEPGEARVTARSVTLGRSGPDRVAVLDGLERGDQVVIDGMFALREGAAVVVEATPSF